MIESEIIDGPSDVSSDGGAVEASEADDLTSGSCLAPPARVELTTNGLGKPCFPKPPHDLSSSLGEIVGLSEEGLHAIAAGGPFAWAKATRALEEIRTLAMETQAGRRRVAGRSCAAREPGGR